LRRLEQEAHSPSALHHPTILTSYDIGQVDGPPFIAMEFVDGEMLLQRMASQVMNLGRCH
jgi:serine/threonine protein kinase